MNIREAINLVESAREDNAFWGVFELPIRVLEHWDTPTGRPNDSGHTIDSLSTAISKEGQIRPIEVGFYFNEETNEVEGDQIFVFDGNHRLASMKKIGRPTIQCINSHVSEAMALARDQITALGGKIISQTPTPRDEFGRPV